MERDLLAHFPLVMTVARRRGFAAAAAELGMSPSAVSHAVKTVEDRLGLPLFTRTTRSVALTEAGENFLTAVGPALAEIGDTVERLRAQRGRVSGTLRINAPRIALSMALTPIIARLATAHPALTVEVTTDDGLVDIVAGGFDAGIRLGAMIAQDMIAVRLTPPFKAILVASPAYLADHGTPRRIADLSGHNCIGFRMVSSGGVYAWEMQENGKDIAVEVHGSVRVTDAQSARDLALAGVGIAYIFQPAVQEDLRQGRLCWLLPRTAIEEPGLFLYYPRRASQTPKLRAFIAAARAKA
jgi:DNA-binding transcriptional LysR family regulator